MRKSVGRKNVITRFRTELRGRHAITSIAKHRQPLLSLFNWNREALQYRWESTHVVGFPNKLVD